MSLPAIALMTTAALATWAFPRWRRYALLLISLIALYALQPDGLKTVLPTATLLLVVGVWWIVSPQPSRDDYRLLIVLGGTAAMLILANLWTISLPENMIPTSPTLGQLLGALPPLFMLAAAAISGGAIIPRQDVEARRRIALAFIGLVILLLVILKLPSLQQSVSKALVTLANQPIFPDWQWLGFSYIAFRLMHVLLDYRSRRLPDLTLRDFALYVIFFPALPAGPIDRFEHFVREMDQPTNFDAERLTRAFTRIGTGLFKKFILADMLAYIALSPALIAQTKNTTPGLFWLMLYAYAFRLYFDFSGYTDIAIGIGILAGIKLPENFTAPYTKRNITAFWNSWHITLATWFRNYFFTPLSRHLMGTRLRSHRLLIIFIAQVSTMILIGLWHGIALNFVLWGAWHGVGLWSHRWLTDHARRWDEYVKTRTHLTRLIHVASVLTTFHFVALGWVFFALPDLALIGKTLAGLVGLYGR